MPSFPEFSSIAFLQDHIQSTMGFYQPNCIDPKGGFFHFFKDNGDIYDADTRHLVSSTRFVFNYAKAYQAEGKPAYLDATRHGLEYLRGRHRRENGGYVWLLSKDQNLDETNHCYGFAFVMLAYATAYKAGVKEAKPWIEETFHTMEEHFWDAQFGLYKDEISSDWQNVSPYRGQNANMHSCEALLAAYDATHEHRYLERATLIAKHICQRQAALAGGEIWEHYTPDWQVDWDYNKDNPKHLFRPWGFQPGHQTEWAKLLLLIHQRSPLDWLIPTAQTLFDSAWQKSWDHDNGGLCYGYDPEGNICDGDKYFWVQAESFAAAAMLAILTKETHYWDKYQQLWQYSWSHMIDHQYGAWFRILTQDNQAYDDCKSPAGKTDYHTMGACYEVIDQLTKAK
ncbi:MULTISPECIES: AGE family epimerase/isomerase [Marinomonas]|uniref:AGE family epimerase/isomerase n=1 Tax=Marinomonas arctica TaxID=383750 RepID=A0A7H1J272_9GAMM|nr:MULTISPECIES: AGE family epimerase/isomerase [Marinomonas]MCS7488314.1 N-acylglucosamine 2-epimerase [Marinomonas sp. BSi20414]QNT04588.1 AGE family epimerase/isomerase [Marinomonas arctica]GGN32902.1 N-acylglucosamine 2-epimerase [Marinomonas arctica]